MQLINKNCKPVLHDLYDYDFERCYYKILQNINPDLIKDIDPTNKELRNIKLGLLQKENPNIASFLISKINNIMDLYLSENGILEDDIIWRQKDGVILTKQLNKTNISMEIKYKGLISTMISSMKKDRVLFIYDNKKVVYKGIKNKLKDMSFFDMFATLNFTTQISVMDGVEVIRHKLFESDNINWFIREVDDILHIPIKNKGTIKVPKTFIWGLNPKDIDRSVIWDNYLWPFCQTLLLQYGNEIKWTPKQHLVLKHKRNQNLT